LSAASLGDVAGCARKYRLSGKWQETDDEAKEPPFGRWPVLASKAAVKQKAPAEASALFKP
jgi:hypothetical protein